MGVLIAFWFIFTAAYLVATEVLSMAKSRGEVLIFRRSHLVKKKSTWRMAGGDEEALRPPGIKMVQLDGIQSTETLPAKSHIFHWQDVCYDIKNKKEVRRILDHVDGWVQPGTLTALMVCKLFSLIIPVPGNPNTRSILGCFWCRKNDPT